MTRKIHLTITFLICAVAATACGDDKPHGDVAPTASQQSELCQTLCECKELGEERSSCSSECTSRGQFSEVRRDVADAYFECASELDECPDDASGALCLHFAVEATGANEASEVQRCKEAQAACSEGTEEWCEYLASFAPPVRQRIADLCTAVGCEDRDNCYGYALGF